MRRLLALEWKLLWTRQAMPLGAAVLLLSGVLALAHGQHVIARQQATLAESGHRQADEHRRVLGPLPASANAADQLYYLAFHTTRAPSVWAPVALGQRDVQAYNLKIRIHALQGQLYDADFGNPLLASLGHFDLAFVVVVLAPLLIIAVTYDVYSGEVEAGTWGLVRSQPVQPWRVLAIKAALRGLSVWLPLAVLQVVATVWLDLPLDRRWWTAGVVIAGYVAVWMVAVMAVAALRRSSDVNVLLALGLWVTWTALGPALLSIVASARFPMPEALELTVLQRQGYHGAWDEPLPVVMDAFYRRYPEWRGRPVPTDRYSNAWYYAMQQRGDDVARDAARRYRVALDARDRWVGRWAWWLPPAAVQRQLTAVARTDLSAYLAYLDSVADYHEALKRHFLPVIFAEAPVGAVDWSAAPRHNHRD